METSDWTNIIENSILISLGFIISLSTNLINEKRKGRVKIIDGIILYLSDIRELINLQRYKYNNNEHAPYYTEDIRNELVRRIIRERPRHIGLLKSSILPKTISKMLLKVDKLDFEYQKSFVEVSNNDSETNRNEVGNTSIKLINSTEKAFTDIEQLKLNWFWFG